MKQQFETKETMYENQIKRIKQKIAEVQLNVEESTHDLSIAIETAPKQTDQTYDHLDGETRADLERKDI